MPQSLMVYSLILSTTGCLKFGSIPGTSMSHGKRGTSVSRYSSGILSIRAVQDNEGPQRLVDIIRTVPEISRNYLRSPSRRALFGGKSLLGGFYVAQTISLSFGALGVNDVIAAVLCVLLTEYVTRFYYSRPKAILSILLFSWRLCSENLSLDHYCQPSHNANEIDFLTFLLIRPSDKTSAEHLKRGEYLYNKNFQSTNDM